MYLGQQADAAESVLEDAPAGSVRSLYTDLLGADNLELAEAAEWDGLGPMSATELDEVQALLERVLPDPGGFAQRLLLQAMARWGQAAEPSRERLLYSRRRQRTSR